MLVTLIRKRTINKLVLPENPLGNYWLTENEGEREKKLINIEGNSKYWQIMSNNNVKIINPEFVKIEKNNIKITENNKNILKSAVLKEYCTYFISLGNKNEICVLYCLPSYEEDFKQFNIKRTREISIGKGSNNEIIYENPLISDIHARIFLDNGRWNIQNLDSKFGTFIKGNPVVGKPEMLFNGDVIFIMGLRIIVIGNSLFINNPDGKMRYNSQFLEINENKNTYIPPDFDEEIDENEIEIYSEKDYFSRSPRIINVIESEKIKIDEPPQMENKEEMPAILVIGSSLTMGIMMVMSMVNTINKGMSGDGNIGEIIFSLVTSIVMLIGMILFPVLSMKWEKKRKKRYEEKRQKRYKAYLSAKRFEIDTLKEKQKKILFDNYIEPEQCVEIILNKGSRLWERKIESNDFLSIRIGIGDVPLKVDIQYPEEQFSMEDDNLVELLKDIEKDSKNIKNAPVVVSLTEKNVSALIVQENIVLEKFIQNLIIQLIAFHSYEDLKLVFLFKKSNEKYWEYVKMLPHVWDNAKEMRFFADDYDDMKEISKYLENELRNRQAYEDDNINYKVFSPYYLIITDDYKRVENLKIITEVLKSKTNYGFSLLCITDDLTRLPNETSAFISIDNEKGLLFENEISSATQRQLKIDLSVTIFFERICQTVSNIPIRYSKKGTMLLPNNYTFLEMYDAGLIEQLNIIERWKRNDSTLSLKAPIGIDSNGMPVMLDIHEKAHGPHGLIAGSTGSGKSEFIITYILSLAVNYHPYDVNFLLIDYKGGGLAGAFQKRNIKLPHLVGTITNIDTSELQRSQASIQSELKRRQVIFNEARNITEEGTMDIYKYQKLYHDGIVKEPVPHLLIICDEFAELKQQQEEFMNELISVSRIGRSLGVHLILATQKPAGVVNDEIRSNSKFAICLKVQDTSDSMDVIKKPDAANLKKAGQFYMQVGNDDYFVLGQSAWSGAPYFPSDKTKKKVDNSIQFISNIGTPIKEIDDNEQKVVNSDGEQLTNILKNIYELAKNLNITTKQLWLEKIPETIYIDNITKKYKVNNDDKKIELCIGEYDDPYNQRQGIVKFNLLENGNMIIYGNAESGKETLLSTIAYNLMTSYSTERVNLYLLDFGSETLKAFTKSPHVGDVVFINDEEKINRFFDMIQQEIIERKNILSDYNGDYNVYLNHAKKPLPMWVVLINNYTSFAEAYEDKYEDILQTVCREGIKCGIIFIVTTNTYNDIRYRLTQNFKQRIVLQLNNDDDYYSIFDNIGKKRPAHIFGRGLVPLEDGQIYEFQTAKICDPAEYNVFIEEKIKEINNKNKLSARNIPTLPDKLTFNDVEKYLKGIDSIPIGITKKELRIYPYNFKKRLINVIVSKNTENAFEFIYNIIEEIKQLEDEKLTIFSTDNKSNKEDLNEKFNEFKQNIKAGSKKHNVCIILGTDKFFNNIEYDETDFTDMLKRADEAGNYTFIFVENVNKFKTHEYDEWYKEYISSDTGIYVGGGIDNQYVIEINDRLNIVDNCGRSFGYVVEEGSPVLIKLIGMKEKSDIDE